MSSWWGITATLAGMAAFGSSAIFFATSRSSPIAPKALFFLAGSNAYWNLRRLVR